MKYHRFHQRRDSCTERSKLVVNDSPIVDYCQNMSPYKSNPHIKEYYEDLSIERIVNEQKQQNMQYCGTSPSSLHNKGGLLEEDSESPRQSAKKIEKFLKYIVHSNEKSMPEKNVSHLSLEHKQYDEQPSSFLQDTTQMNTPMVQDTPFSIKQSDVIPIFQKLPSVQNRNTAVSIVQMDLGAIPNRDLTFSCQTSVFQRNKRKSTPFRFSKREESRGRQIEGLTTHRFGIYNNSQNRQQEKNLPILKFDEAAPYFQNQSTPFSSYPMIDECDMDKKNDEANYFLSNFHLKKKNENTHNNATNERPRSCQNKNVHNQSDKCKNVQLQQFIPKLKIVHVNTKKNRSTSVPLKQIDQEVNMSVNINGQTVMLKDFKLVLPSQEKETPMSVKDKTPFRSVRAQIADGILDKTFKKKQIHSSDIKAREEDLYDSQIKEDPQIMKQNDTFPIQLQTHKQSPSIHSFKQLNYGTPSHTSSFSSIISMNPSPLGSISMNNVQEIVQEFSPHQTYDVSTDIANKIILRKNDTEHQSSVDKPFKKDKENMPSEFLTKKVAQMPSFFPSDDISRNHLSFKLTKKRYQPFQIGLKQKIFKDKSKLQQQSIIENSI